MQARVTNWLRQKYFYLKKKMMDGSIQLFYRDESTESELSEKFNLVPLKPEEARRLVQERRNRPKRTKQKSHIKPQLLRSNDESSEGAKKKEKETEGSDGAKKKEEEMESSDGANKEIESRSSYSCLACSLDFASLDLIQKHKATKSHKKYEEVFKKLKGNEATIFREITVQVDKTKSDKAKESKGQKRKNEERSNDETLKKTKKPKTNSTSTFEAPPLEECDCGENASKSHHKCSCGRFMHVFCGLAVTDDNGNVVEGMKLVFNLLILQRSWSTTPMLVLYQ